MEQKFEGLPKSEIRVDGSKLVRTDVVNDWGSLLQWVITQNGKQVAAYNARPSLSVSHDLKSPGEYQAHLQMWKYVDYKKNPQGEFINSKFVEVSEKVKFTI
jgi:hypothetical protein